MDNNFENFNRILQQIREDKILLPDFQRKFVWTDEEMQKKLIASVLAKMPIGSILLLESNTKDYASKRIGTKNKLESYQLDEKVKFLLDGQQRITVLTNIFSNYIHNVTDKVSHLVSPTLKRRFFLKLPKYKCESEDIFGLEKLDFSYNVENNSYPPFLAGDIINYIVSYTFSASDKDDSPYNPNKEITTELDQFCLTSDKDYFLVPLFLVIDSSKKEKLRLDTIIHDIALSISNEVCNKYIEYSDEEKIKLLKKYGINEEIILDLDELKIELNNLVTLWVISFKEYLGDCTKKMYLNIIDVSLAQRGRAIEIYENLNLGGVSLSTFDLIMAKVAVVNSDNFYDRLSNNISKKNDYPESVIPDKIINKFRNSIISKNYNASLILNAYNKTKDEIDKNYIDMFLNVMSFYCNNSNYISGDYKVDATKRTKILDLNPKLIDENCEKICIAIDRALFFFNTRCGIRTIKEINYSLFACLVGVIFTKDEWFNDVNIHNKLEALYWASVFSGNYDKDQNTRIIGNLNRFVKSIATNDNFIWINNIKNDVFKAPYFSEKKFILMQLDMDRYPKTIMKNFICQFFLAKTYPDMFDNDKTISVFLDEKDTLEAHHIIPLGSVKNIKESSKKLRKDKKSICNSPINFVYITSDSNKRISDKEIDTYANMITNSAKSSLFISNYTNLSNTGIDEKSYEILEQRFNNIDGEVRNHINSLMG